MKISVKNHMTFPELVPVFLGFFFSFFFLVFFIFFFFFYFGLCNFANAISQKTEFLSIAILAE